MNTSPRDTLRNLIVQQGQTLIDNPRRLEAFLRDYCGTYRQEISVLTVAAEEGIPPDLLTSASTMPLEIAIAQQTKRLQSHRGLTEDSARWSVQTWAFALGLISEVGITASSPPPVSTPSHQPPPVPEHYQRETINPPNPHPPEIMTYSAPQPITTPSTNPPMEYAEFWQRMLALIIDIIIVNLLGGMVGFVIGIAYIIFTGSADGIDGFVDGNEWFFNLIGIVIAWFYYAKSESSEKQATLGKRILRIQVTNLNGQRISFDQATGRHISKLFSALIFGIGFLMPLFDPQKQALHDKISNCLVVKR